MNKACVVCGTEINQTWQEFGHMLYPVCYGCWSTWSSPCHSCKGNYVKGCDCEEKCACEDECVCEDKNFCACEFDCHCEYFDCGCEEKCKWCERGKMNYWSLLFRMNKDLSVVLHKMAHYEWACMQTVEAEVGSNG